MNVRTFYRLTILTAIAFTGCSREPDYVAKLTLSPTTVVVRQGQCAPVKFSWTPAAELSRREGNPTVFVHLLDGPHNLVRTFDHPLGFPWSIGKPVEYEIDLCQSALATPLAPGTYGIKVGLYDDAIGYRWPLETNGVDAGSRGYRIGQLVVPSTPGNIPTFRQHGSWGKVEVLTDKQRRARQPFTTGARIRVEGVREAGTARMMVQVPEKSRGVATITTTCGGRWSSPGPGHHVAELPIASSDCEITLDSTDPAGAFLEGLGWKTAK